ncbi:MAG: class I SAM-dependent methyltransferase [Sphingomonadales bacterium]|nr:class I SAM-dependent methyltransferase [Sphingomonadales bacterium]
MLRSEICYQLSKTLIQPPSKRTGDVDGYADWRDAEMRASWQNFSNLDIDNKDIMDFGCGEGPLSLYLARHTRPRSILGVDIDGFAIDRANQALSAASGLQGCDVRFILGETSGLPAKENSVDTILAFDCMEHIMAPQEIMAEWSRVLRPGGKVLIEWYPFKGPYGPHMNSLIPMPWAHILFGERALFETAARIYDEPNFIPHHWDLDERGRKRPNKWAQYKSFAEQGYLNQLDIAGFKALTEQTGFDIVRQDNRGFGHGGAKKAVGQILMQLPLISEYFVNYTLVELQKR